MKRTGFVWILSFLLQCTFAQQQNLDFYLSHALTNSPLLADYRNQIRSTAIDSLRLAAARGLQVQAVSNDYYAPVIHGWGYDEVVTDGTNLTATVAISKDFMGRKNLQNHYWSLRLQNQSANLEGQLTGQELRKNVIAQYITAYGTQQEYELNKEILSILREEEQWVKKLVTEGSFRQTEYLSLLVNLRQHEVITRQSYDQSRFELGTLNYICGLYDTVQVVLPDPALIAMAFPDIRNSITYRQFETDSLKLVAADKLIDFEYKPKLSAFANAGYLSTLTYMPWKNFGAMAGLNLTIPIYDGGQRKMQHDQIAISQESRAGYLTFYRNQYYQQVYVLNEQLTAQEKLEGQLMAQLQLAQSLIKANQTLLNAGDIPVTDYLLSVNNYVDAKNILLQHKLNKYLIINEINYWSQAK